MTYNHNDLQRQYNDQQEAQYWTEFQQRQRAAAGPADGGFFLFLFLVPPVLLGVFSAIYPPLCDGLAAIGFEDACPHHNPNPSVDE
ncbi:hypothetical protein V8J82_22445 [Gymnodinialimonas sp. 2305UL16-5]|uniref:hypothetical protein n=1 Tax=Gymnodinialimonas mytili TaxID=3126503 RepID=UPI0030B1AF22